MVRKKEANLLVQYYKGLEVGPKELEKLNKLAQKILNDKKCQIMKD